MLPALSSLNLTHLVRASEAASALPTGPVVYQSGPWLEHRETHREYPAGGGGKDADGRIEHFKGLPGDERMFKVVYPGNLIFYYTGGRGRERLILKTQPARFGSGLIERHYEGEKDEEHLVHVHYPNGIDDYFEGEEGDERLVRSTRKDSTPLGMRVITTFYEGDANEEYVVAQETADTEKNVLLTNFYRGKMNHETLVRSKDASGTVTHFEGEQGDERKVRTVDADGIITHFKGKKNKERKVRTVSPDGTEQHFEGSQGNEQPTGVTTEWGSQRPSFRQRS